MGEQRSKGIEVLRTGLGGVDRRAWWRIQRAGWVGCSLVPTPYPLPPACEGIPQGQGPALSGLLSPYTIAAKFMFVKPTEHK